MQILSASTGMRFSCGWAACPGLTAEYMQRGHRFGVDDIGVHRHGRAFVVADGLAESDGVAGKLGILGDVGAGRRHDRVVVRRKLH